MNWWKTQFLLVSSIYIKKIITEFTNATLWKQVKKCIQLYDIILYTRILFVQLEMNDPSY